jgi:hypothetical protein
MKREFFQVVGRGPLNIDHPNGKAVAYRPGQLFEESPLNKSVARGLRAKRLRKLSQREADSLKAMQAAKRAGAVTPTPGLPKTVKPTPKTTAPSSSAAPSE